MIPGAIPITFQSTGLRCALLALALCFTTVAGEWWQHSATQIHPASPIDLGQMIPHRFAAWQQDDTTITRPISPTAAAAAEALYAKTLERVYIDTEQRRIMLSISYGGQQGDRLQAHRPEFCYQAQGFTISAVSDEALVTAQGLLPVRRLETRRTGRNESVSYWMTVGSETALPGLSRKLAQLRQGLTGQVPEGFLVRVSSISESSIEAFAMHDQFITDLLQAVSAHDRLRLAGKPSL